MSPDDTNPEGEFSAYCLSKDGGQTWGRRYTMGAGANIDAAYSQAPLEDGIWVLGSGYLSLEPYLQPKSGFSYYSDRIFPSWHGCPSSQRRQYPSV